MSWLALGAAAVLQLLAGVVRARAWFHVIRQSWGAPTDLRYRDVVVAHFGGVGWNAVLPAHSGDAVKVLIVNRRLPERRLALLVATLVPTGLVEAALTLALVAGLVGTGLVSLDTLTSHDPGAGTALVIAGAAAVVVAVALLLRRRIGVLLRNVRAGVAVLARPRALARFVVPWLLAARAVRLLAYACVLPAAGLPVALVPALALMALQGATPSAGAAASAARIAVLSAVLSTTVTPDVSVGQLAAALAAAYVVTSTFNVAVSGVTVAWLLRTTSPRRILSYVRTALVKERPARADAVSG